jgi:hypothetical protein
MQGGTSVNERFCAHCGDVINAAGYSHLGEYNTIFWCRSCALANKGLLLERGIWQSDDDDILKPYPFTFWTEQRGYTTTDTPRFAKAQAIEPLEGVCPQCRRRHE